jgi:predicted SAM-dependent methyltransferase
VKAVRRAVERAKRIERPLVRDALLRSRGALHYAAAGHARRRAVVSRYLARTERPRLHIGAGPYRLDGWLDSDLIGGDVYLDLTRPLPLPDASFDYVFGEHVVEHLTEQKGEQLFRELRRVLRPGGVARLTTPDLRKIVALYRDENPVIGLDDYARFLDQETGKRHERGAQVFNDYLRLWGHRYVYDEDDLTAKLLAAGFSNVERAEPGESVHDLLRGLERHGGAAWVNQAEAMCIEATA